MAKNREKTQKSQKKLRRTLTELEQALRLSKGPVELSDLSTTPLDIGPQDKETAYRELAELGPGLAELQEKLYAESTLGGGRSVLLLLQGMDTSGKDGVINHVVGLLDPGSIKLSAFKSPTAEERKHDFLWRVTRQLPGAGQVGVFNRSHYEDVLIVRVRELVDRAVWSKRFAQINAFERELTRSGVTLIKCFLHISKDEQAERLLARLDDPTKHWKFNPADIDERALWDDYQQAYADVLRKCNTVGAPWYVIPSDKKWYRNWSVAALLRQKMSELAPEYPPTAFDIEAERQRLMEH